MTNGKPVYVPNDVLKNVEQLRKDHFVLFLVKSGCIIRLCTDFALVHSGEFDQFLRDYCNLVHKE